MVYFFLFMFEGGNKLPWLFFFFLPVTVSLSSLSYLEQKAAEAVLLLFVYGSHTLCNMKGG